MPSPESPTTSVIRLEGEFDLPAARMLEDSLRAVAPGNHVRLDFSRVRRLHDLGIATLARALQAVAADAVKLQGLSTHHVRLLRYFGVDAAMFGREADEEAEG